VFIVFIVFFLRTRSDALVYHASKRVTVRLAVRCSGWKWLPALRQLVRTNPCFGLGGFGFSLGAFSDLVLGYRLR